MRLSMRPSTAIFGQEVFNSKVIAWTLWFHRVEFGTINQPGHLVASELGVWPVTECRASASDLGHPAQGQTLVLDPLVFLGRKRPALDAAIVDFVVIAIADCAFG